MVAGDGDLSCGSCNLKVTTRSKSFRCWGKCGKPFHISDYTKFKSISDITLQFCEHCILWLGSVKKRSDNDVVSSDKIDKPVTDELSSLSSNYKAMSENIISLGDEQNKIRSTAQLNVEFPC